MPKKSFSLTKGGPKEIVCSWGFAWKNFSIFHNGVLVGTIPNQKELKEGRSFLLCDGSTLTVRLKVTILSVGLELFHNGIIVGGSDSDPYLHIKIAYGILLFLGILNLVVGTIILASGLMIFGAGIGLGLIIFGIILGGLSFGVKAKSITALIIAIALLISDALASIYFLSISNNHSATVWIIIRILFIVYLFRALKAIKKLKTTQPLI